MQPQWVQDTKLHMDKEIDKDEINNLLVDEEQAVKNNFDQEEKRSNDASSQEETSHPTPRLTNDAVTDDVTDDKILESNIDEVSKNESLAESDDITIDITNDYGHEPDPGNNNDEDDVINMIDDMMNDYKNEVLPGLVEVISTVQPTVR